MLIIGRGGEMEACLHFDRMNQFQALLIINYMIIIIGLGNPGSKYQKTRHNLGFRVIDKFAREEKFPQFKVSKKFNSLILKGKLNKKRIILVKPRTFMNESGKAVKSLVAFYKITRPGLVVIHDDIDLPLGEIKIVKNRGAAGHKGAQSIIGELGTKNFIRFRIGIKPKPYTLTLKTLDKFVLQKFNKEEEKVLKEVITRTYQAIKTAITEGIKKAMQKFNC